MFLKIGVGWDQRSEGFLHLWTVEKNILYLTSSQCGPER